MFSSQWRPYRFWDASWTTNFQRRDHLPEESCSNFSPRDMLHLPRISVQLFTVPMKFRTAAHHTNSQTHCHCHRTVAYCTTYTFKQASSAYSDIQSVSKSDNNGEQMMGLHTGRTDGQQKEVWEPNLILCTTCGAEVRKRTAGLGNNIRTGDLQNKKHECQNNSRQGVVK